MKKNLLMWLSILSFGIIFLFFVFDYISDKLRKFNSDDVLVGETWDIYLLRVKGLLTNKPEIVNHKLLLLEPDNIVKGSELRSYDPTYIKSKSNKYNAFIIYEPCYFKNDLKGLKYDCNLQYFYLNTKDFKNYDKKIKTKIFFDPDYKVSFPTEFSVYNQTYYLFESANEKEVKIIDKNTTNAKSILKYNLGIFDPIVLKDDNNLYLIGNTENNFVICQTTKNKFIQKKAFKNENCEEYDLGQSRYERNAGSIFNENGKTYRFTMNNSKTYGKSVDLVEITNLNKQNFQQKIIKNNFLLNELLKIDKNIIKYHHISIIEKESKNTHLIIIDAAKPNFSRIHGKKIQKISSFE